MTRVYIILLSLMPAFILLPPSFCNGATAPEPLAVLLIDSEDPQIAENISLPIAEPVSSYHVPIINVVRHDVVHSVPIINVVRHDVVHSAPIINVARHNVVYSAEDATLSFRVHRPKHFGYGCLLLTETLTPILAATSQLSEIIAIFMIAYPLCNFIILKFLCCDLYDTHRQPKFFHYWMGYGKFLNVLGSFICSFWYLSSQDALAYDLNVAICGVSWLLFMTTFYHHLYCTRERDESISSC